MTRAAAARMIRPFFFRKAPRFMSRRIVAALLLALAPALSFAQEWKDPNVANAKEHPLLKFYPQSSVTDYTDTNFDGVDLFTGYDRANQEAKVTNVEGRVVKYTSVHKPGTSSLEILRNYENALRKTGFVTLLAGKASQFPNIPVNPDDSIGTFRLDRNGKPAVYVSVTGHADPDTPGSTVTIVEIKAMEQKLEANADAWFDEIARAGRVAVYGINFDTGKATLRPESNAVLEEVRKLAASHPDLKLRIEGHTDNVGNAAANRKLSEERANAVRGWLVAHGVKAGQLAASGLGDTKPVADNKTEDGRAKNRRVELVRG